MSNFTIPIIDRCVCGCNGLVVVSCSEKKDIPASVNLVCSDCGEFRVSISEHVASFFSRIRMGPELKDDEGEVAEVSKPLILVQNDKAIDVVKCPYCLCLVPTRTDGGDPHGIFDSQGDIIFCTNCEARLSACPVCQMNSSQRESVPAPRKEHSAWYDPKFRFYGYTTKKEDSS